MRINREQFNKWIRALRSGRYKQATGTMQNEEGYCCLGVGCKILIPKDKLEYKDNKLIDGQVPDNQTFAPKWLKEINRDFEEKTGDRLSALNDFKHYTFKQIADVLVKAYPERKRK